MPCPLLYAQGLLDARADDARREDHVEQIERLQRDLWAEERIPVVAWGDDEPIFSGESAWLPILGFSGESAWLPIHGRISMAAEKTAIAYLSTLVT